MNKHIRWIALTAAGMACRLLMVAVALWWLGSNAIPPEHQFKINVEQTIWSAK